MDLQSNISGFTAMSGFHGLDDSAVGTFEDKGSSNVRGRKDDAGSAWDKRSDYSF